MSTFYPDARTAFARAYPEVPHKLVHSLHAHPLLELAALASLAEALPTSSIEYNAA
ncbi:MAG TPA: transcriptional regulator, partial [Novosphingobium sp.]